MLTGHQLLQHERVIKLAEQTIKQFWKGTIHECGCALFTVKEGSVSPAATPQHGACRVRLCTGVGGSTPLANHRHMESVAKNMVRGGSCAVYALLSHCRAQALLCGTGLSHRPAAGIAPCGTLTP